MTILDTTDKPAPAATETTALSGAKWQADYQTALYDGDAKIVKVADQDTPGQAAPGDQGDGDQKIGVKEIVAADPKDLSPNLQTLQGLAGHFDKADDKAKAMGEVKGAVEKTISAADAAQTAAEKDAQTESVTLKPQFDAAKASMDAAKAPFQAAFAKVPEADREHVGAELGLLADDKTSPALKKAIEADLASRPGLVDAANKFIAAETAAMPVMEKVKALQDKMEAAAEDPVVARMVYADMLEQSGDKAGAKQVQAEAMALQMGMTIDQFHQLQQQQKQQQK
jgi:hypothetical protein